MRFPWINVGLLALLLLQAVTGYLGFVNGDERQAWLLWLHGMGAYAIVLALAWKGAVIWNVLQRGKRWTWARVSFLVLLALLLLTLALGILWTFTGLEHLFGFSLLSLHIYVAIPLLLLLAFHVWRMRWILQVDRATDRRAFLRVAAITAAATLLWQLAEQVNRARRFTGSYEVGSFGGWFPRVSWINDDPSPVSVDTWRLELDGAVQRPLTLDYSAMQALAEAEKTATIDCTGGWYSTQVWAGVPLAHLLRQAGVASGARSITVRSVTGYYRKFDIQEVADHLLALSVAGEALSHGHGFPVRLVVPDKRGYEWVKWVTHIQVNTSSHRWQPPLPLQ